MPSSPGQLESVQTSKFSKFPLESTEVAQDGSEPYREEQRSLCLPFLMKGNTQLPQLPIFAGADLLQVTLQSLEPASFFFLSLRNSTTMAEVEVNTNFFFFPQTLNRTSWRFCDDKLEVVLF